MIAIGLFLLYYSRAVTKEASMKPENLGQMIRKTRKSLKLNQSDLALASGTATRFISDLENGKPSCHLGKTLSVLSALGIRIDLTPPTESQGS